MGGIGSGRKKTKLTQVAIDSSGNIIEVFTILQAARYLGVTMSELKLQLYCKRHIPYYKVFTKTGRRVLRIKKRDLDNFELDSKMYDRIADRIRQARQEHVYVVTGLPQADLAKSSRIQREHLNRIERKKVRVGINALRRIGKVLEKPIEYFLD